MTSNDPTPQATRRHCPPSSGGRSSTAAPCRSDSLEGMSLLVSWINCLAASTWPHAQAQKRGEWPLPSLMDALAPYTHTL